MPTSLTNGVVLPDPGSDWQVIGDANWALLDGALGDIAALGDSATRDIGTGADDVAAGDAPLEAANTVMADHIAEDDPHTQYLTEVEAAETYVTIDTLGGVFSRPVALQPLLLASASNVSYPIIINASISKCSVLAKPASPNDGSNYWEAHLATADVELATWNTIAMADDDWTLVDTTTFSKTALVAATDILLTLWFTPVGTPGELTYTAPIVGLV